MVLYIQNNTTDVWREYGDPGHDHVLENARENARENGHVPLLTIRGSLGFLVAFYDFRFQLHFDAITEKAARLFP